MKKLINNRIIAFVIYLVFLSSYFLGGEAQFVIRALIMAFYCVLIVEIQSKSRVVKNKISWIIGMFIFSPIVFPFFLISDKKYFKIAAIFFLNLFLVFITIVWLSGVDTTINYVDSIRENQLKISEIEEQYKTVNFDNLNENSVDLVINLSKSKKDYLDKLLDSIDKIKSDSFVNWDIGQSVYYKDYSDYMKQFSVANDGYIVLFRAIKEKQSDESTNELFLKWKEEDQKANNLEIKSPEQPTIWKFLKPFNKIHFGFLLMILMVTIIIFSYIKMFKMKGWKIWTVFSINILLALLLIYATYYAIVFYVFKYSFSF